MKKTIKLFALLVLALFATTTLWSCDNDHEELVGSSELPATALKFINTYYPAAKVASIVKDKDDHLHEYEVTLSNVHKLTFDSKGEWQKVDAPMGQTIPSGFYPSAIDQYVLESAGALGINEISKEKYGFEVDLINGLELKFNLEGVFIGIDQ